jgi:CRP-like cAMP-binding protein
MMANCAALGGRPQVRIRRPSAPSIEGEPCMPSYALPLSGDEVADFLALNSDTLSRFLTRMKTDGLVTFLGHRRVVIAGRDALLRRCPIADVLVMVLRR